MHLQIFENNITSYKSQANDTEISGFFLSLVLILEIYNLLEVTISYLEPYIKVIYIKLRYNTYQYFVLKVPNMIRIDLLRSMSTFLQ